MSGVQPDHCSTCGDLVASGEKYLKIEGKLSVANSVLAMAVARLGGEVAGSPTHRGNFLQRIDELRTLERDLAAAREQCDANLAWGKEWERNYREAWKEAARLRGALDQAVMSAKVWEDSYFEIESAAEDAREEATRLRKALESLWAGDFLAEAPSHAEDAVWNGVREIARKALGWEEERDE